ncbi:Hypothetical predicted protein [Lecanosticta acicola]|uniref:Uncharacterized protein n=1 Tax=Lecanosticta acicola TaxID=111012 RepID=A0AAI8YWY5_9PEZI|nr:Hypothetical predicted protein [Lecanosticta acicola]
MAKDGDDGGDGGLQKFPLFKLPDEIWSKIGKLAIDNEDKLTNRSFLTGISKTRPAKVQQPAITRTSKDLRADLLHYYYFTKVKILCHKANAPDLSAWLHALGHTNRLSIRGMKVLWRSTKEVKEVAHVLGVSLVVGNKQPFCDRAPFPVAMIQFF